MFIDVENIGISQLKHHFVQLLSFLCIQKQIFFFFTTIIMNTSLYRMRLKHMIFFKFKCVPYQLSEFTLSLSNLSLVTLDLGNGLIRGTYPCYCTPCTIVRLM